MNDSSRTITGARRSGERRLRQAGVDTPGLDAEVLLRHLLGVDRATLFARLAEPIEPATFAAYLSLIAERARGVPVAYLTGEREFMGLPFAVSADVLVPRPETEILVEWALDWLAGRPHATVVDVGAGSGAIALSIAALLPPGHDGSIIAIDVSGSALTIAARNRTRLGLDYRVALLPGSLLDPIAAPVELILANLPYLRPEQIADNRELAAEPRLALDGGADGLALVRQLLDSAPRVIAPGGAIGLEIDPEQRLPVVDLSRAMFPTARIDVLPDLSGLARHVVVQLEETEPRP
jgi:release factor glutamine methyltransferase